MYLYEVVHLNDQPEPGTDSPGDEQARQSHNGVQSQGSEDLGQQSNQEDLLKQKAGGELQGGDDATPRSDIEVL